MTHSTVSITGTGLVTTLGTGVETNWSAVMAGRCGLRELERFDSALYTTCVAGEVPQAEEKRLRQQHNLPKATRAILFSVAAAREALEQARLRERRNVMLVLSTTKGEIEEFEKGVLDNDNTAAAEALAWRTAAKIAELLGISRPAMVVSNACASGLVAMDVTARMIARGEAEKAIVVGVDTVSRFVLAGFSCLAALSSGPCRPYDAERDGLSLGEGAGAVVLERNADGEGLLLCASAVTNDAHHVTAPMRSGDGLAAAIGEALRRAGVAPADVDVVNGHGTGTVYNDAMESKAVSAVFGRRMPPLYSLKGYVGHTLGAAGVAESVIALKGLAEGIVPGTLGLSTVDSEIDANVSPQAREAGGRYLVSFKSGFGGINAASVFERAET